MAFPISKEVNGEKKDMEEACFLCIKGEDGKVQLKNPKQARQTAV